MSTYDKASLILPIAPGIKANKIYCLKPTNVDADFDFSRSGQATRVNKDGLIELVDSNVPRLNYPLIDGVVSGCPSLLLEPARTNLVTYSEDFSNAAWTKSNSSITSNSVISPDGTLNADKLVVSTSSGYISGTFISSGNTDVTVSFFVKSDTLSNFNFTEAFYFGTVTNFDLSNGTTDNGKIENYGNGWYRCSKTYTYASQQIVAIQIKTGATGSLYIFGGQFEQGSYATSYIPTQGSTVTRVAETCSQTPPSGIIGQTEGVVYTELNITNLGTNFIFSLDDGGASDFIILDTNSVGELDLQVRQSSGSITTLINGNALNVGINKVAVKYKSGDYSLYLNGTLQGTSSSTLFPSGVISRISVGGNLSYGYLSDKVKDVKLYDTALTDQELIALTS